MSGNKDALRTSKARIEGQPRDRTGEASGTGLQPVSKALGSVTSTDVASGPRENLSAARDPSQTGPAAAPQPMDHGQKRKRAGPSETDNQPGAKPSKKVTSHRDVQGVNLDKQGGVSNKREFACPHCDRVFDWPSVLRRHRRAVHEGHRDFKCPQCPSAFGQRGNLNHHIRAVHERRRDYQCQLCASAFTQKGALLRHLTRIHKDLGIPHAGWKEVVENNPHKVIGDISQRKLAESQQNDVDFDNLRRVLRIGATPAGQGTGETHGVARHVGRAMTETRQGPVDNPQGPKGDMHLQKHQDAVVVPLTSLPLDGSGGFLGAQPFAPQAGSQSHQASNASAISQRGKGSSSNLVTSTSDSVLSTQAPVSTSDPTALPLQMFPGVASSGIPTTSLGRLLHWPVAGVPGSQPQVSQPFGHGSRSLLPQALPFGPGGSYNPQNGLAFPSSHSMSTPNLSVATLEHFVQPPLATLAANSSSGHMTLPGHGQFWQFPTNEGNDRPN